MVLRAKKIEVKITHHNKFFVFLLEFIKKVSVKGVKDFSIKVRMSINTAYNMIFTFRVRYFNKKRF